MFAYSFSVLSIDCFAQGRGASFLYKCPASLDGSLQQHGFLVICRLYCSILNVYEYHGQSVGLSGVLDEATSESIQ